MYGPITTIHRNGHIIKHLPWSAFRLSDSDLQRVLYVKTILEVCRICFQNKTILLINSLGLEQHTTVLLFGEAAYALARSTGTRGTSNGMGEKKRRSKICPLQERIEGWSQKAK